MIGSSNFFSSTYNIFAVAFTSTAKIYDNSFQADAYNIALFGLGRGIHDWKIESNNKLIADNNIFLSNTYSSTISKNQTAFSANQYNIICAGGNNSIVGENTMDSQNNGMYYSQSPGSFIYCNKVTGHGTENQLQFISECAGTNIINNEMSGLGDNLHYGSLGNNYANTGVQYYKYNEFDPQLGGLGATKAVNFSDRSTAILNQYLVDKSEIQGNIFYPFFSSAYDLWFFNIEFGSPIFCLPSMEKPNSTELYTKEANNLIAVLDSGLVNTYGSELEFNAKIKLLRSLKRLSDEGTLSPEHNQWFSTLSNSEISEFISFEEAYIDLIKLSEYQTDNYEALVNNIKSLKQEITNLNYLIPTISTQTISIDQNAYSDYTLKMQQLKAKLDSLNDLIIDKHLDVQAGYQYLESLVENISVQNTISGELKKQAIELFLKRINNVSLTTSEIQTLENISNQCAGLFGEGVYTARSLLAEIQPQVLNTNDECVTEISQQRKHYIGDVVVSPNPSNGIFSIKTDLDIKDSKIEVYDILGKLVYSELVNIPSNLLTLDLSNLTTGLYIIKIPNINFSHKVQIFK